MMSNTYTILREGTSEFDKDSYGADALESARRKARLAVSKPNTERVEVWKRERDDYKLLFTLYPGNNR
jgi:hypothetical protein